MRKHAQLPHLRERLGCNDRKYAARQIVLTVIYPTSNSYRARETHLAMVGAMGSRAKLDDKRAPQIAHRLGTDMFDSESPLGAKGVEPQAIAFGIDFAQKGSP